MKKILIVYASNAGSTAEISQYLADQLSAAETNVQICSFKKAKNLDDFDSVILGAPMMREFHPGMHKFIIMHQQTLLKKKVAFFTTALKLTGNDETTYQGISLFLDNNLIHTPRNPEKLNFVERKTSITTYLSPLFTSCPEFKPVQIAFFGGALKFHKLKWIQVLFVLLLLQFKPVDKRNWVAVKNWADQLKLVL